MERLLSPHCWQGVKDDDQAFIETYVPELEMERLLSPHRRQDIQDDEDTDIESYMQKLELSLDERRETDIQEACIGNIREWQNDLPESTVFQATYQTEQEAAQPFISALDAVRDKRQTDACSNCSRTERILTVSEFKKGLHISMPSDKFKYFCQTLRKQFHLYRHHAIVKKVISTSGSCVKMALIHFVKQAGKMSIYETTETYDLKTDEIYKTEYCIKRHSADEAVKRAEDIVQKDKNGEFDSYNFLLCNCEHFATWCVNGEPECFQTNVLQEIFNVGSNYFGKNIRKLVKLIKTGSDEIIGISSLKDVLPAGRVMCAFMLLHLIYSIVSTVIYKHQYCNGNMCFTCYRSKMIDIWLSCGIFCSVSVQSYIILQFALPLVGSVVGTLIGITLIVESILIHMGVRKIGDMLSTTPFTMPRKQLTDLSDANIGDVLSYKYYTLQHHGIIVGIEPHHNSSKKGTIQCVHYGLPCGWPGSKKIINETIQVNLEEGEFSLVDFSDLPCFDPEVVVARAKSRIGEQKWWIDNQSDHFCMWAKEIQAPTLGYMDGNTDQDSVQPTTWSTTFVKYREIHLMDEVQVGDVVYYKGRRGILTKLDVASGKARRHFDIEMIRYVRWKGRKSTYSVNLDRDRLWVSVYHPAQCRSMAERARRAQAMVGRTGRSWTEEGFFLDCILRESDR